MNLEIINTISNVFTSFGTVGAVVVALWLAYRDSKPKLRVNALVGVITPEMSEHLWLSCTNVGKQSITCTGFAFNPNKFKKTGKRIMPHPRTAMNNLTSVKLPMQLQYSEKVDQHFGDDFFNDTTIKKFLAPYKWVARIQLNFLWRVVATTNIQEFEGKLSKCLVEKLLTSCFPNQSS